MTVSGTFNFGFTTGADELITEAFERIGREASTLSANDLDSARRALQYTFSEWNNRGINLWTVSLNSSALTQGQMALTLAQQNVEIFNCYRRQTSGGVTTDTTMSAISRAEYAAIPNKQQQSQPTQFYLERTVTPTVYFWPTPQDASYTFYYYSMNSIQDVGAYTNTIDAPQRWFDAMASAMAARLAVKWAPERLVFLQGMADTAFQFAAAEDTENVNMRITPDFLGRRWA